MTASHGTPSVQERKKKQQKESTTSSTPATSSQRLEDLAAQASSPRDQHSRQSYLLRSTKGDSDNSSSTGKNSSDFCLRPSYISGLKSNLKPNLTGSDSKSKLKSNSASTPVHEGMAASANATLEDHMSEVISDSNATPSTAESREKANIKDSEEVLPPKIPPAPPAPPTQEVIRLADVMARLDSLIGVKEKIDEMAEDIKQLRSIKETTTALVIEVSEVKESVTDLQSTVSSLEAKEEETELNQQAIAKELVDLKQLVHTLQEQLAQQPAAQQPVSQAELEFFKLKMEAALRWNNLIIEGIKEPSSERDGSTRRQVQSFLRNVLGISHAELDKTIRLGKPRSASAPPRPILVRFIRPGDREDVWRAKTRLGNHEDDDQFSIKEDLPPPLRPVMAALMRVLQSAKRSPKNYAAFIRDFKIHIDGVPYDVQNLESLPRDLRPSHASTPGNSKVVVFFGKASRFSNHYPSPFTTDDSDFSTMEQFLAHSRARFANDQLLMDKALESPDPAEAKRILNRLRGAPGQTEWEEERHDILLSGLLAKFRQSEDLREYLLSSKERQLGEASRNSTWGIGMTLTNKDRFNVNCWSGGNLLGKTLMEVRQILALEKKNSQQPPEANQDPPGQPEPSGDETRPEVLPGQPETPVE